MIIKKFYQNKKKLAREFFIMYNMVKTNMR